MHVRALRRRDKLKGKSMDHILRKIKQDLLTNIDEGAQKSFPRFFRNEVKFYGVKSGIVRKIAKESFKNFDSSKKEVVFVLCEQLFQSGLCEEAWIAAHWLYWISHTFIPEDLERFEEWIDRYIDDWAKCDTLCNHAMGSFIMNHPSLVQSLKQWTSSPNPFVRRASAVSLIIPARQGHFLKEIFQISDILLLDQNDLVQKGYGWMLKEASRKHPDEVFLYIMQKKESMPRTAFRYALEKMPPDLRKIAMERTKK